MWNRISASSRLAILKEAEDKTWGLVEPIDTRLKTQKAMAMWTNNTIRKPFDLWVVYYRKTKETRLLLEKRDRRKRLNAVMDWHQWAISKKETRIKTVSLS
jgi:hypothetical protein